MNLREENERLKEWCRKLIEGGTFPGEADSLRARIAELEAEIEKLKGQLWLTDHPKDKPHEPA